MGYEEFATKWFLQIKVEGVHPVVYDEYINIDYRQNTTIKLSNDYH
jgi:hypothetical protein